MRLWIAVLALAAACQVRGLFPPLTRLRRL